MSDEELIDILCTLTQDVIDGRHDLSGLSANYNSKFFQVFMDCHGETVAARNRLAENETLQLTNEKVECEANIAANEDLCALIRTILKQRRNHG
jgi:hypothetical protein